MATYTAQAITKNGDIPTVRNAASGDKITPDRNVILRVTNASVADVDLTLAVPGNTNVGVASPDKVITIAPSTTRPILLLNDYIDPSDGLIPLSWEATASVTYTVERV